MTATRAYRLKLAGMAIAAIAGVATAYFKDRHSEAEQRGVDRYRLDAMERRQDELDRELNALRGSLIRLLPFVRNVPALPVDGDTP